MREMVLEDEIFLGGQDSVLILFDYVSQGQLIHSRCRGNEIKITDK